MKKLILAAALGGLLVANGAMAQTAPAPAAKPAAAAPTATPYYTTEDSTIGDLLDNPATKAVLAKHLPEVVNGEGINQARGMTLPAIQQFSQGKITDEALEAIDKDLAAIPAPKN